MNTRKTIYNKLFSEKTELAKHEVELASLKDLLNINSNLSKDELKFDAINIKLATLIKEEQAIRKSYIEKLKLAKNLFLDFEKGANELGIVPSNIVEFKDLKTSITNADFLLKQSYK